jgi:hypothetical protein
MLLSERDQLTKHDAVTVARIERGVLGLVSTRDLIERHPAHRLDELLPWNWTPKASTLATTAA